MCSFFKYTWTLDIGHNVPVTISAVEYSPEIARQKITSHISGLDEALSSIDAADSLRDDINNKLRLTAAAAVGIPLNDFCNQISAKNISLALDNLLQTVQPTIEPTEQFDHEPTFICWVSVF